MVKRKAGPADAERTLDALTREIQRLQEQSAKVSAELEELRQHLSQLYVNLAPLDPRLETSKPRKIRNRKTRKPRAKTR
jgi:predicted  nucleic acid-binding Zn-ribbon protein